uniref:NADH-ubiquinone oxidoreductase chain 5 n=1 Tax=Raeta sp. TaxID=3067663 RepID=A0AA49X763_9BIVA|nr:NADH dehydrogenase subunit 5 [Raeta sp.]
MMEKKFIVKIANSAGMIQGMAFILVSFSVLSAWLFFFTSELGEGWFLCVYFGLSEWLLCDCSFCFMADLYSCAFSSVVCLISTWVVLYTAFYMGGDKSLRRFMFLVMLFVISMNLLIFSPSMISLMIGWDGLGVFSYVLVCYYLDSGSCGAAALTIFSNRVGDFLFILFIGGSCVSFDLEWFSISLEGMENWCFLGILMLMGSLTKSAQLPFSAWLPAAMAAPTPVSALVHSSTLVTAGVYMLIRFYSVLSDSCLKVLCVLCMVTFFIAGIGGLAETDIKKIVALSTLSQVSFMMFALSLGAVSVAFFHLVVHALFKALMFLAVGCLMSCAAGSQDIRLLSSAARKLPLVSGWVLISFMCLCGLPFMSGFYSKDLIIEVAMSGEGGLGMGLLVLISVILTTTYSSRVLFMLFSKCDVSLGSFRMTEINYHLSLPISMMGVSALLGGYGFQTELLKSKDFFPMSINAKVALLCCLLFSLWWGFQLSTMGSGYGLYMFPLCFFEVVFTNMMHLKSLSGWWVGSQFQVFAWNASLKFESFWIQGVIWGRGVGSCISHTGHLVREAFSKELNLLVFSIVFWVVLTGTVLSFESMSWAFTKIYTFFRLS